MQTEYLCLYINPEGEFVAEGCAPLTNSAVVFNKKPITVDDIVSTFRHTVKDETLAVLKAQWDTIRARVMRAKEVIVVGPVFATVNPRTMGKTLSKIAVTL